jgi:D-alanyl-D-alanine carboxypeptidase/D-alanyl-D-alanine-endopeptidase (penicillin-binding protein 4)
MKLTPSTRYLVIACALLAACAPLSKRALTKTFQSTEKDFKDHIGFVLYDVAGKKTVFDFQGDRYFTPASNTKIFTLYASLKLLGDSIPGLRYVQNGDSLIFWGTGDPGFLYKNVYTNGRTYNFLKSASHSLYFSAANFQTEYFGPGWAWDDYTEYYSPERSPLPVYGNIVTVQNRNSKPTIEPRFFRTDLIEGLRTETAGVFRPWDSNVFTYHAGGKPSAKAFDVPIKMSHPLTALMLGDTLKRPVRLVDKSLPKDAHTLKSIPADSLYRIMMQESDNFIAEQLLLMCAGAISDTLKPEIAIRYMKKNYLADLPDEPVWKDGSGLSRFNLFTPRSIVQLWQKIYETVPRERLFPILAIGGKKGTIRNYFKETQPYIYGKTGTLSNNHALSGYLVTRSGKLLIFSFMNTHFTRPTGEVRNTMQSILHKIYESY